MPIYEFRCRACTRKTTALVLVRERISEVRCKFCGAADLERLWSRFATVKSEEARMDALSDPSSLTGLDENDPASMMRWMKRMGEEMGEDIGEDMEQAMEEELREGAAGDGGPDGTAPETGGGSEDL
jgi:putative FmdB family regulatory protein